MKGRYEKTKKIRHLGRKVNCLVISLLAGSMIIVVSLCVYMFYNLTMNMLETRCVNGTNMLAYQLENYKPKDKTPLLDELKEHMGCEFTIFQGNERVYTTIQQEGKRAVGTKLSDDLAKIILEDGQSYVGKAHILGNTHICSYVPTRDSNGKINGLIFAGISIQEVAEQINLTILLSCAAGAILTILGITLLSLFINRSVSKPLSKLTALAQTMEQGNLGLGQEQKLSVEIHSNDEIGFLADIFEKTMLRLRKYIGEISITLDAISNGNLTVQTTQDYVGDFTSIKDSLDDILRRLNHTMSQIAESSDYVSNGSKQMATGAQALSQGSLEQSSSIEELETTIQDISLHVSQTAENAQQANQKVKHVNDQILESNQKMKEMILAMNEINNSSSEIGKIIKAIDNIAQQTNILALNSAVEAARAGEAGKGFAVVAKEVRELAGKSSEASQSTATLIERSIAAVEYGTKIANETASQLAFVVSSTGEIVETTNEIANAACSQADSVSQIQEQISQISNVVQTNSATAEESAATSEELNSQAELLKSLIDTFHLK